MIKLMDANHDGCIGWEEFEAFMMEVGGPAGWGTHMCWCVNVLGASRQGAAAWEWWGGFEAFVMEVRGP